MLSAENYQPSRSFHSNWKTGEMTQTIRIGKMQIPSSEWINSSFLSLLKKSIGHFLSLYSFNKLRSNTFFLFYPLYFFQQRCRTNYDNQFRKNIFKIVTFSRKDIGICHYFALQFSAFPKWHSCSLLKTTLSKMS